MRIKAFEVDFELVLPDEVNKFKIKLKLFDNKMLNIQQFYICSLKEHNMIQIFLMLFFNNLTNIIYYNISCFIWLFNKSLFDFSDSF